MIFLSQILLWMRMIQRNVFFQYPKHFITRMSKNKSLIKFLLTLIDTLIKFYDEAAFAFNFTLCVYEKTFKDKVIFY